MIRWTVVAQTKCCASDGDSESSPRWPCSPQTNSNNDFDKQKQRLPNRTPVSVRRICIIGRPESVSEHPNRVPSAILTARALEDGRWRPKRD
eukprot:13360501-Heterocapsa_arctica.AAC.1